MKISREDVVRVAELAYLDLSESELETYRKQIDEILEYIGKLNELDTANVAPISGSNPTGNTSVVTARNEANASDTSPGRLSRSPCPVTRSAARVM